MEVTAILLVERLVTGYLRSHLARTVLKEGRRQSNDRQYTYIVVSTNNNFELEFGLLDPLDSLLELRECALVSEIAGVDKDISRRELGCLIMSIRYAHDANSPA